jgi:hypothetical protein
VPDVRPAAPAEPKTGTRLGRISFHKSPISLLLSPTVDAPRRALPNATFIAFTGTPLIAMDAEKTKEVFAGHCCATHRRINLKSKKMAASTHSER